MFRLRHRAATLTERAALASGWCSLGEPSDREQRIPVPTRIVYVCSGNICRSPYAHKRSLQFGLIAASCGTECRGDDPADPIAIEVARSRGVDLSTHRTTPWSDFSLASGDLIVAAQFKHAVKVWPIARSKHCRVLMMSALLLPNFQVVTDPFGRGASAFVRAFDQIDCAVGRLVEMIR